MNKIIVAIANYECTELTNTHSYTISLKRELLGLRSICQQVFPSAVKGMPSCAYSAKSQRKMVLASKKKSAELFSYMQNAASNHALKKNGKALKLTLSFFY